MRLAAFLTCLLALPLSEGAKFKDRCDRMAKNCEASSTRERRVPSYEEKIGEVEGEPGKCWWSCDPEELSRTEKPAGKFAKELLCWQGIYSQSLIPPADAKRKFKFPTNVGYESLLAFAVQEDSKQTYFFTTKNAGYKDEFKQSNEQETKYYSLLERGRTHAVNLDSVIGVKSFQMVSFSEDKSLPGSKELVDQGDASFRATLIQALQERVQNLRSTFQSRSQLREEDLRIQVKRDSNEEKKIEKSLGWDYETTVPVQNPEDYTRPLTKCLEAFGDDDKYTELVATISSELNKFSDKSDRKIKHRARGLKD